MSLIWRIRDRATFTALTRQGTRCSRGPLTVVYLGEPASPMPPRVAFSVPRAVGRAVDRNLVRRRLRAVLGSLAAAGRLGPGAWLLIARPGLAATPSAELESLVAEAVGVLTSRSAKA